MTTDCFFFPEEPECDTSAQENMGGGDMKGDMKGDDMDNMGGEMWAQFVFTQVAATMLAWTAFDLYRYKTGL
jgi:hypothetical protein